MIEAQRALSALMSYMQAMTDWENECEKQSERDDHDPSRMGPRQLKKLQALEDKWCTQSKWRRATVCYGWPADYDPALTRLLRMEFKTPEKFIVDLQLRATITQRYRLQLEKVGNDWKIARRWNFYGKSDKPDPCQL